jgi:hypothetical protein
LNAIYSTIVHEHHSHVRKVLQVVLCLECIFVNDMWDVGILAWIQLVVLNVHVVETCINMPFDLLGSIVAGLDRCLVVVVEDVYVVCGVDHR